MMFFLFKTKPNIPIKKSIKDKFIKKTDNGNKKNQVTMFSLDTHKLIFVKDYT